MDRIAIPDSIASAEAVLERAEREMLRQNRKKKPKTSAAESSDESEPASAQDESHALDEIA
jgi:hypothetical protein